MEVVEFGRLTAAQRRELEGDEEDPFDAAGFTLRYRPKERHVGLRDDGSSAANRSPDIRCSLTQGVLRYLRVRTRLEGYAVCMWLVSVPTVVAFSGAIVGAALALALTDLSRPLAVVMAALRAGFSAHSFSVRLPSVLTGVFTKLGKAPSPGAVGTDMLQGDSAACTPA